VRGALIASDQGIVRSINCFKAKSPIDNLQAVVICVQATNLLMSHFTADSTATYWDINPVQGEESKCFPADASLSKAPCSMPSNENVQIINAVVHGL